ncbi:hypothetical protein EBR96_05455 [bacterium]|nr:hypothetical protein [bacterium]
MSMTPAAGSPYPSRSPSPSPKSADPKPSAPPSVRPSVGMPGDPAANRWGTGLGLGAGLGISLSVGGFSNSEAKAESGVEIGAAEEWTRPAGLTVSLDFGGSVGVGFGEGVADAADGADASVRTVDRQCKKVVNDEQLTTLLLGPMPETPTAEYIGLREATRTNLLTLANLIKEEADIPADLAGLRDQIGELGVDLAKLPRLLKADGRSSGTVPVGYSWINLADNQVLVMSKNMDTEDGRRNKVGGGASSIVVQGILITTNTSMLGGIESGNKPVALKKTYRYENLNEVVASEKCQGKGVTPCFGYFKLPDKETLYSVMEAAAGTMASRIPDSGAPLDESALNRDVTQLLQGLSTIHEAGYIHRDIKPENILTLHDGSLAIGDLGLAQPATVPYDERGTQAYLARFNVVTAHDREMVAAGITLAQLIPGCPFSDKISGSLNASNVIKFLESRFPGADTERPAAINVITKMLTSREADGSTATQLLREMDGQPCAENPAVSASLLLTINDKMLAATLRHISETVA